MPLGKEGSQGRGSDLEELPELKPTVASFLRGSPETLDKEGKKRPPEPDIVDFGQWVKWKLERCKTPDWWEELLAVLGKEDAKRLAREMRASFILPQQMQELDSREATLQAPPAPPCLCRKKFMPPADSIFACRDIQEILREKVVAYAWALQYWAEQNNPPARGESCLLVRSILELREEVRWYLSSTDEEVFKGCLSLRRKRKKVHRTLALPTYPRHLPCLNQHWKDEPRSLQDGRRCCTHPGQWWLPETSLNLLELQGQRRKWGRSLRWYLWSCQSPLRRPLLYLSPHHRCMLWYLHDCRPTLRLHWSNHLLHVPKLVEVDLELPVGLMPMELVAAPGITSMSSSCIVKDELTGVTYMEMVITSIGRVTISGPGLEAFPTGPTIEDIMDSQ